MPEFTGDFESGQGDWSVENGLWEIGTPTAGPTNCYSGSMCAGTILDGYYPARTDSRLISPTVKLPTTGDTYLRFKHWFSYYNDGSDGGYVQLSVKNEETGVFSEFQTISSKFAVSSGEWISGDVDLTAFAGLTVRLAFYHNVANTNAYSADESHGWFIDEVEIGDNPILPSLPPVLDQIGDQTVDAGDLLCFPVTASYTDCDEVTLTVSNLPDGATFIDNGDGTGE